jgi:DNA-binding MarR family transcriptional regulator
MACLITPRCGGHDLPVVRGQPTKRGVRLTYRTTRVMAVIGAQAGLSNARVAERAGISDQGQVSKLLARLKRQGLIENTGAGQASGSANAWRLTRAGRELLRRRIERGSVHAAP